MEYILPENTEKRWKSPTPFNRFSSSFHQNDRTVSGHLILATDDLEKVGQGQHLQKCSFLTSEYFYKKLPMANFADGNM